MFENRRRGDWPRVERRKKPRVDRDGAVEVKTERYYVVLKESRKPNPRFMPLMEENLDYLFELKLIDAETRFECSRKRLLSAIMVERWTQPEGYKARIKTMLFNDAMADMETAKAKDWDRKEPGRDADE